MNHAKPPTLRGAGAVVATIGAAGHPTLYEQLLGDRAAMVHPAVRRLHLAGPSTRASGTMQVHRGRSLLARGVAVLLRLPPAGDHVPVHLSITRRHDTERWCRVFGHGPPLTSIQQVGRRATLVERYGPLALQFALTLQGAGLRLRSRCVRLQMRGVGFRLPRCIAPRVAADVQPGPAGSVWVSVQITAPVAGLLLSYDGHISVQEPDHA